MFRNDSIAGNWSALVARLNASSTVARWGTVEPALAGLMQVEDIIDLLSERASGEDSDAIVGALVRLAACDSGAADDDALLLLLHCLSGMVLGLARDLGDLHSDILAIIVGELTCQIRTYLQRGRTRAFAENLRLETRRAVLAELRPSVRNHPELGEQITEDGQVAQLLVDTVADDEDDLDVVDLLTWSVRSGVDAGGVLLLIETEQARAEAGRDRQITVSADRYVANAHGLCERTLYRRRARTLTALRSAARTYLADVA